MWLLSNLHGFKNLTKFDKACGINTPPKRYYFLLSLKSETLSAAHFSSTNISLSFPIRLPFQRREVFIYSRRTTYSSVTCYLPTPIWELLSYQSGQSNPTTLKHSSALTHAQIRKKKPLRLSYLTEIKCSSPPAVWLPRQVN